MIDPLQGLIYALAVVGAMHVFVWAFKRLLTLLLVFGLTPGDTHPSVPDSGGLWYRYRVASRRQNLLSAYGDVFKIRHDKGPGISPTFAAYDYARSEGLMEIDENQETLVWRWPEET